MTLFMCLLLSLQAMLGVQAELKIAILMQGSDFINVSVVPVFDVNQFDLGDVYISPCRAGTYNEARDSYCKDCSVCSGDQYESVECIPVHNSVCSNCTVCTDHDQEVCTCGQRSGECLTGNRVCLPLPATAINLTFDLTVSSPLSSLKERFLQEGLRTGFVLYLSAYLQHPSEQFFLLSLVKKPPFPGTVYTATFVVNNVYSLFTKTRVTSLTQAVIQSGLTSTFGIQSNTFNTVTRRRARRLLQNNIDLLAGNVAAQCIRQGGCGTFFVMLYPEDPCKSVCEPIPCPEGYTGFLGLCEICPNATYKSSPGNGTCTPCPSEHTSDQGSTDASECFLASVIVPVSAPVITSLLLSASTSASMLSGTALPTPTLTSIKSGVPSSTLAAPSHSSGAVTTVFWQGITSSQSPGSQTVSTNVATVLPPPPLSTTSSSAEPPPPPPGYPSQPFYSLPFLAWNQSFMWNVGQSGNTQSVVVYESSGDWALLVVSVAMLVVLVLLGCAGVRLFLTPVHQDVYYYYNNTSYTKIKEGREIPIPIRRPSPSRPTVLPTPWKAFPPPDHGDLPHNDPSPQPQPPPPVVVPQRMPSFPWAPLPPPSVPLPVMPWAPLPSPSLPQCRPAPTPWAPTPPSSSQVKQQESVGNTFSHIPVRHLHTS